MIDLPVFKEYGPDPWRIVRAEIVDVAPHITCATWAVHRSVAYYPEPGARWCVSNIETGLRVGKADAGTKAEAVRRARTFLRGISDARVCERNLKAPKECR